MVVWSVLLKDFVNTFSPSYSWLEPKNDPSIAKVVQQLSFVNLLTKIVQQLGFVNLHFVEEC